MERTMDALLLENSENDRRLRWAVSCAAAGLWCLPALTLSLPKGLLPFGVLLLASTLLVPLRIGHAARQIGWPLAVVAGVAVVPLLVALVSIQMMDSSESIDGRDRLLVLPWAMAWAFALNPPREMLWRGALTGLLAGVGWLLTRSLTTRYVETEAASIKAVAEN